MSLWIEREWKLKLPFLVFYCLGKGSLIYCNLDAPNFRFLLFFCIGERLFVYSLCSHLFSKWRELLKVCSPFKEPLMNDFWQSSLLSFFEYLVHQLCMMISTIYAVGAVFDDHQWKGHLCSWNTCNHYEPRTIGTPLIGPRISTFR